MHAPYRRVLAMLKGGVPLQQILMVPSGALTMTLMRWRSLENSITSRVSYCTSCPKMFRIVCVDVRRKNSKPRVRAHSTSATSSGDGPCSRRLCCHPPHREVSSIHITTGMIKPCNACASQNVQDCMPGAVMMECDSLHTHCSHKPPSASQPSLVNVHKATVQNA